MPLAERPATALYERPPVVGGLELHRHWSESWAKHQAVLASESSADVVDLLQADIAPVPEVTCALLYAVLTDKANAARYLGLLNQQASRDRFACCTAQLNALVPAYYCCLKEAVRGQLLLLLRELVAWEAAGADTLCLALLRQVVSGSMEGQNVWLACSLVDVLRHQVAWMRRGLKDHLLLHAALYTVLRMLPEAAKGGSPAIDALRSHGSALAANLLTEHWQECAGAGRDLIRCLQDVSNMPEFRSIWAALLAGRAPGAEPGALPGQPDALTHVLSTRTPKDVLSSRLTPDAEVQLYFIMSQVRNGNHKRYQTWYTAKHLQGPHAETLIPDLVRYIVGVYHPANYVLASDIIPRWAVLGWLLQYPRTATGQANTRLALLFDWPFFVPQTDSIMNIEPAMLLMTRSIPRYATMTNALLEFLIIASEHFWPCGRALVRRGLGAAVDTLVKRGVVRNLNGLARCEEVAPHLRRQLDHLFPAHANSGLSREAVGRASTSGPADSTSPATSASEGPSSSTRPAQEPARDSAPSQAARREGRKHAWEEAGSSEGQDAKRLRVQAPGEAPPGQLSADDTSEQSEEMESEGGEEAGTLQQQLGQSLAALGAAAMQAQRAGELPDILRSLLDALAAAETGQTASAKKRKRGEQKEAEASATLDMLIKEAAASITSRVELAAESDGSMPWWQDAGMDEVREGHNGSGEGQAGGSLAGSLARWALEEGEAGRQHLALRLLADLRNSQATCTIGAVLLQTVCQQSQDGSEADEMGRGSPGFRCYSQLLAAAAQLQCESDPDAENHNPGGLQRELFVEDLRICLAWGLPPFQRLLPALLRACPALFAANAPALYLLTAAADPPLTQRLVCELTLRRCCCCLPSLSPSSPDSPLNGEPDATPPTNRFKRARQREAQDAEEAGGADPGSPVGSGQEAAIDAGIALIRASQGWDLQCQGVLWQLLIAEVFAHGLSFCCHFATAALQFCAMAVSSSPDQDAESAWQSHLSRPDAVSSETVMGLLSLLRMLPCTAALTEAVHQLPTGLSSLAAAAQALWDQRAGIQEWASLLVSGAKQASPPENGTCSADKAKTPRPRAKKMAQVQK